jgi:hypothetical protein
MGNPRCFCTMYRVCINEQIRIRKHPSAIGRGLVAGYKSADIARARCALACTQKPSRATWSPKTCIPPSQNGPCVLLGTVMSVYLPGCCPGMLKAEDGSSKQNQPYAGYVPALLRINHLTLSLSPQHLWRPSCPPPSVVIGASSLCYLIPVSQRRPRQSVVGEGYITCSLLHDPMAIAVGRIWHVSASIGISASRILTTG